MVFLLQSFVFFTLFASGQIQQFLDPYELSISGASCDSTMASRRNKVVITRNLPYSESNQYFTSVDQPGWNTPCKNYGEKIKNLIGLSRALDRPLMLDLNGDSLFTGASIDRFNRRGRSVESEICSVGEDDPFVLFVDPNHSGVRDISCDNNRWSQRFAVTAKIKTAKGEAFVRSIGAGTNSKCQKNRDQWGQVFSLAKQQGQFVKMIFNQDFVFESLDVDRKQEHLSHQGDHCSPAPLTPESGELVES